MVELSETYKINDSVLMGCFIEYATEFDVLGEIATSEIDMKNFITEHLEEILSRYMQKEKEFLEKISNDLFVHLFAEHINKQLAE